MQWEAPAKSRLDVLNLPEELLGDDCFIRRGRGGGGSGGCWDHELHRLSL